MSWLQLIEYRTVSSWQIFENQEVQGPIPGQGQLGFVVEVEDAEQVPPVDEGR